MLFYHIVTGQDTVWDIAFTEFLTWLKEALVFFLFGVRVCICVWTAGGRVHVVNVFSDWVSIYSLPQALQPNAILSFCLRLRARVRAVAIEYFSNRVFYRKFHRLIK